MPLRTLATVGCLIWIACSTARCATVGSQIDDFRLQDFRGRWVTLGEFKASKFVVVTFLGTECPLAKLYGARLSHLSEIYGPRGVSFLGINANRQDSITEIAAYARIHKIPFPILKDVGNRVADSMGAVRTPEVYVLDADRRVRYRGRIDDQYGVGYVRDAPTREDLKLALDDLLAGRAVRQPTTEAVGCHIGRIREADADGAVTFSDQIARLLQRRCVECHREGDIAPFALEDYDEVAGWADTIAEVVRDERMPPWHASAEYGQFVNTRRLSDEEKQLIYTWAEAGAPEGDPDNLPEPLTFTEGWQLAQEPDIVIPMREEPFQVPAEGEVKYQYFTVDPGFEQDKWIAMGEVLPGNRAVVHHVLVFVREPGSRHSRKGQDALSYLVAYVPGLRAAPLPPHMAKRVPAGSELVFQVHYTPIGSAQEDLSVLGLVFADPEDITMEVVTTHAIQTSFRIPPHAENHRVTATSGSYDGELLLLSMAPHMHLRGKSFRYTALYPDGNREILLDVPRYDFNWQTTYRLETPKPLPPGTRMHCVAYYDNSDENLANPDPTATVRWGDQTWDEMMIGFFDVAVPKGSGRDVERPPVDLRPGVEDRARQLLDRLDKDGDGMVAADEVSGRFKKVFIFLDRDRDQTVSLEELVAGMKLREKR